MAYKNIEDEKANKRKWAAANREKCRGYLRKWWKKHRIRLLVERKHKITSEMRSDYYHANKVAIRYQQIRKMYNLTKDEFDSRLSAQKGLCPICRETLTSPHVDHDHNCCPIGSSCGKCVRGLLCNNCNRGMGLLRDSPTLLRRALKYVVAHGKKVK